jgi:hypothetical protein
MTPLFDVMPALGRQTAGSASSERGMTLPVVLALVALLQLIALAQLDIATVALRSAVGLRDRVVAFYAADAALAICARKLSDGALTARVWAGDDEPAYWRLFEAFDGDYAPAIRVAASWTGALQAPQCLLEMAQTGTGSPRYLLTARGVGASSGTQAWMQAARVGNSGRWFWRSVAQFPR